MKRVAIVGGGMAGLTMARLLRDRCECVVFERESSIGGLMRCSRIDGHLFHLCGGHVFNSKDATVLDWFWGLFNQNQDFIKAERNSAVCLGAGQMVPYPIENNVYRLSETVQRSFAADLSRIEAESGFQPSNFDEFLLHRFGRTLYDLYFRPYNRKIWKCDLATIPLSWLEGKLPMPTVAEMRKANAEQLKETSFVHSSFWYPLQGGSQFVADTLGKGTDIRCGQEVSEIKVLEDGVSVNGALFDSVVYCGNVRSLPQMISGLDLGGLADGVSALTSHGTTSVLCEVDANPYSWVYQPESSHDSHRIILTGNFSPTNNAQGALSATVEFTDEVDEALAREQLRCMPFNPRFKALNYTRCSYPIQSAETRRTIARLKSALRTANIHLVGRFAEWEYYNMDAVIASAMRCVANEF